MESDSDYRERLRACMEPFGHYGTNVSKWRGLELDSLGVWLQLPRETLNTHQHQD